MKFNAKRTIKSALEGRPDATRNYEGGLAFSLDPKERLYLRAASSLVGENKFYEDAGFADSELITSIHDVLKTDPEFVLKLAVHLREKMYLRSVPLVLCAEYANVAPGTVVGARNYISRCIARADEIPELIAYQFARNKIKPRTTKLPMAIKAAVSQAFNKFDRYQFAKWSRDGDVTMRDALFLTHPKPERGDQQDIFNAIVDGTLEPPMTWEVMRSTGKMDWSEIIHDVFFKHEKVNNYMAILRNLRNMLESPDVSDADIDLVCNMLAEPDAVARSKQMPFRFLSAYNVVSGIGHSQINNVVDALEEAAELSISNIPKQSGTTLIACDVSGSMIGVPISRNSTVRLYDIGLMLGSMAHQFCEHSITGIFGTTWEQVPLASRSGILSNVAGMSRLTNHVGFSTNGHLVIQDLIDNDVEVDRLMFFTDCQMWNTWYDGSFAETFTRYQRMCPNVKLYAFNLSGHNNVMIPPDTKNVCLIGGWSDRIFDFVKVFEGGDSVLGEIDRILPE